MFHLNKDQINKLIHDYRPFHSGEVKLASAKFVIPDEGSDDHKEYLALLNKGAYIEQGSKYVFSPEASEFASNFLDKQEEDLKHVKKF